MKISTGGLCGAALLMAAAACAHEERRADQRAAPAAVADLEPRSGSSVAGHADFVVAGGEVRLLLNVTGASPGTHGVHLHETGDCSAADATSAGGHWNPMAAKHGNLAQPPAHLGDIGNLEVGGDGRGSLTFATPQWTVGTGASTDVLGRALMVHSAMDDFVSQPAGNAGERIACAVVRAAPQTR
jgi:Cu-Zn family superoxide dismutase